MVKATLITLLAALLVLFAVGCREQGWRPFNDSLFASFIPECDKLWALSPEFRDAGSQYAVVNPEAGIGAYYTDAGAVTVTQRLCKSSEWQNRAGLHVVEFRSPEAATRYAYEIRQLIDGESSRDIAYDSVFGGWNRLGRAFTVIAFAPQYEDDPDDELGLHIRAQVGRFAIDHSGNVPFDLSEAASDTFFITLEGMRDTVQRVIARLESID